MKYYPSFVFAILMIVGCGGGGGSTVIQESSSILAPNIQANTLYVTKSVNQTNRNIVENSGGSISSCELNDTIISGFTLNSDCTISGSSDVEQNKTFTITARNAYGSDSNEFIFSVVPRTTATLSGKITFDLVPATGSGLDYNNITQKALRGAKIEIIEDSGNSIGTTTTDDNGNYSLDVTGGAVKVRVYAQLYKEQNAGDSSWDFQVKDNTNGDKLYSLEGSFAPMGTTGAQTRNLNAPSGWGGSSYSSERAAAPFAILDVVYDALKMVEGAQADVVFPPLDIFWSKNNKPASGRISDGDIVTSFYDGDSSFYILGDEDLDTDEYDGGVIAHEWGHYYEAKFSRSDSIGGEHSSGDLLDIRLAFGEGFGNAISSMIRNNPIYCDTAGQQQASGWSMNLETENNPDNPGWFSEASIQRILYDIYDSNDDTGDTISYGFAPIHQTLIGSEKNTTAFTSIFTFIKGLKDDNPGDEDKIDDIVSQESIASITDIYGSGRTNRDENANPLYADLSIGNDVNITTNYTTGSSLSESGRTNQLGAYNFVKVTIADNGNYTISVTQIGNSGSPDPDFYLYKGSSNQPVALAINPPALDDSVTVDLEAGTYRMALIVYNQDSGTSYNVKLVKN